MLFADLEERLLKGDEKIIVVVGDLFEHPICSIETLNRVVNLFVLASKQRPDRNFYILAGNHDISPDTEKSGAFHLLSALQKGLKNIEFIFTPVIRHGIAMFPWEWNRTARDQLEDLRGRVFNIAIGHWDLATYDHHDDHLCPAHELKEMGAELIYSGHWHVAGEYKLRGVPVICTGSMQPMSHAEDPDSKLYVTLTRDDYLVADPKSFENKYVRVIADEGEVVEAPPTCLGWKVERPSEAKILGPIQVSGFDLKAVIDSSLKKHKVQPNVRSFIMERINAST